MPLPIRFQCVEEFGVQLYSPDTWCFKENLPYFAKTFRRLKYIGITKNTDIPNWLRNIKARKLRSSCGSTYFTCLAPLVIRTLRRSSLAPIPKPRHVATRVLCKGLGI
jgi:hypothetical protein